MINVHHELNDPILILEESFRLLKDTGKIAIVDWKKEYPEQGPPLTIRYTPDAIEKQLLNSGFRKPASFYEMVKHFLVIAEK